MGRGEMIGGFNFGSTVVLMFEAPKSFEFNLRGRTAVLDVISQHLSCLFCSFYIIIYDYL